MASWKRSLWDGSARDRLSAYFTPCIVFGKTRYRLDRISRHEDPLDLEDYRAMNAACCDCLFLCLPLGITCSVITSNEIYRVRQLYGISGRHRVDICTTLACPCCAILRNELEVRTREEEKQRLGPSLVKRPYSSEKPMSPTSPTNASPPDKENRAPHAESSNSTAGSSSPPSSVSFTRQATTGGQPRAKNKPHGQGSSSSLSDSSLSLNSSGNIETITCTVVDPRSGDRHHVVRAASVLTTVTERMSEDTMYSAKRSKVCTSSSPPLAEHVPLGSITEATPTGSEGRRYQSASPRTVSHTASPRQSVDRPGTPIPSERPRSPALSAPRVSLLPRSEGVPTPIEEGVEEPQTPDEEAHPDVPTTKRSYQGQESFVAVPAPRRPLHGLSAEKLSKEAEPSNTTPHVLVQGWLDEMGSPNDATRQELIDAQDHAFRQDTTPSKGSDETVTQSSLSARPDGEADRVPNVTHPKDTAPEIVAHNENKAPTGNFEAAAHDEQVKPSGLPATYISTTDAAPATPVSPKEAIHELASQPRPPALKLAFHLPDFPPKPTSSSMDVNPSDTPTLTTPAVPSSTPDIPHRPTARAGGAPGGGDRIQTSFPFTTNPFPSSRESATLPVEQQPTPAPPGAYPQTTPAAGGGGRGGEASTSSGPWAAERGPFATFRARQLLGHLLARDRPKVGVSADRAVGWTRKGGGGHSVREEERVYGPAPEGGGRGRRDTRGGTE